MYFLYEDNYRITETLVPYDALLKYFFMEDSFDYNKVASLAPGANYKFKGFNIVRVK